METLTITARMHGRIIMPPEGYIHLDGLLAAAVAKRDDLPPPTPATLVEIDIPVAKSSCGGYHLATASCCEVEARELRYIQRRFPVQEAVWLGGFSRIDTKAGRCKAFRLPAEAVHVEEMRWWCVGDAGEIRELLALITRLGRRRGAGEGLIEKWNVDEVEPWGDGFPILSPIGEPLRHLPADIVGLDTKCRRMWGRLTYPYWLRTGEQLIACPGGG